MIFKYIASLEEGGRERGVLNAPSLEAAQKILKQRKKTIIKLEEIRSSITDSPYFSLKERSNTEKKAASIFITAAQIEVALDQFGSMLEGGVPILTALQTVAAQSNYFLARALFVVANKLQNGSTFTAALKSEMAFLGNIIIGMINAGEANGDIAGMCKYSVELISRKRKLRGQIIQALTYPLLVVLVTVGIVSFLMASVIPKIMKFLGNRSSSLPPITQALVDSTEFIQKNGPYMIAIPVIIVIAVILLRKNETAAIKIDSTALRLPIIGKILRDSNNMLWTRTMGILLHSGISIMQAMDYTISALNNRFYRNEIEEMKKTVSQGHPLSTALRVSNLQKLIPLADSMLVVGENTGNVDAGLLKVADFCDADLQKKISLLSKLIEPALFIIIGGLVGFVYIAFFMGMMAASSGK